MKKPDESTEEEIEIIYTNYTNKVVGDKFIVYYNTGEIYYEIKINKGNEGH